MSTARKSCYVFEYRITFLGAEKVGKSAIIHQFIKKQFLQQYAPTSEDHMTYVVEHKGNMCVCLLVDTAGSDDFPAMRKLSLAKGNIFVVVYSIDNEKSFMRAKHHVEEIKSVKYKTQNVKIMLVGNKVDLQNERRVPYKQGYDYANEINEDNIKANFVEVTAKDQDSVSELLKILLGMFNVPSMVEVPVLQEKKVILSKLRRSTKKKKNYKLSHPNVKNDPKNGLSDSETDDNNMFGTLPRTPKDISVERFRNRSQSMPNAKLVCRRPSSPLYYVDLLKSRSGSISCVSSPTDISSPKLVNHSGSLHRYNNLKEPVCSSSTSDSCSDDSGLSDDCPSAGESSSPPLYVKQRSATLLDLPHKFNHGRRTSLSEMMKGMFKKAKSVIDV